MKKKSIRKKSSPKKRAPKKVPKSLYYGIAIVIVLAVYVFAQTAETRKLSAKQDQLVVDEGTTAKKGKYTVTIRVRDDVWNKTRVESASLEGQDIRIHHKANIFGVKGSTEMRLAPGEYSLRWTVTKPSVGGNRITLSFHKNVKVTRRGVLVVIRGQNANVY